MATYRFTLTHEVAVEAENIAQARKLIGRARLVPGELTGCVRPGPHDREMVPYRMSVVWRSSALVAKEGER